ncbi:5-oxoprolinase subunit PxpB [Aureibaculum sp. 2210JD6-5]|uniref:5-oxoprolinase subunit PxpB n=1 Tax=Aureibaculum sp. 2210JD6-5 TaxID=3103957 RepID=UPI002AADF1CF|nr:5-oxoprolinase subunit PxpB [Aureibaculum sp. 2210JD6-5]MDY7393831.1 5-oxoprolinase subunit PxpB [Aureibaculum sp. 2210JD6-5]
MSGYRLTYKFYGKSAILIEWPSKIDKNILNDVVLFKNKIIKNNAKQIVDIINTYSSITIIYHHTINIIYDDILALKSLYEQEISKESVQNYRWDIPVCYDKKFGIDLEELESENDLTYNEIISLHSSAIYTVYFIGFLPGFLYLGGLDKKLHIPRKSNPRLRVEKGSVAIGGIQTGIYPSISAGGWHIIGKSPISFFNSGSDEPCFAKSGDEIKFIPIDMSTYNQIESKISRGSFKLKKSEL